MNVYSLIQFVHYSSNIFKCSDEVACRGESILLKLLLKLRLYTDVESIRQGVYLDAQMPSLCLTARFHLNNPLGPTLTSKPELKEQYEALKLTLNEIAKAIGDELTSALSDVQAMPMAVALCWGFCFWGGKRDTYS